MSAVRSDIAGQRLLFLLGFVAAAWLVGAIGGQFAPGEWYGNLHKPLITPPDAVFRLVWAVLYTLTGVAAWLAWDAERRLRRAHALWAGHLALTALWPWLFFGLHRMDLALAAVLALLLVMLFLLAAFWRIRPLACVPLLPYFAWLLFAALLNIAFVGLN
jgi:tryptophan-rich sensory protein